MTTEPMTPADLDAIRAREQAAAPGPWRPGELWHGGGSYAVGPFHHGRDSKADAAFIAHAREDVPRLLAEVERLRARVDKVRASERVWTERARARHHEAEGDLTAVMQERDALTAAVRAVFAAEEQDDDDALVAARDRLAALAAVPR